MKDIKAIAKEIVNESQAAIDAAKDIKDGFSFAKLKTLAREVCVVVETYTQDVDGLSSKDKAELGTELLLHLVNIPFVPEWIEKMIYSKVLNKAVAYMHEKFGPLWIEKFISKPVTEAKTVLKRKIVKKLSDEVNGKLEDIIEDNKDVFMEKIADVRSNLRKRLR